MPSPTLPRRAAALPALVLLAGLLLSACAPGASGAAPAPPPPLYPTEAGPPVRAGDDTVRILPRGAVAFPLIRRLIETAQRNVDVEIYEFGRADLAADLVDARGRGLAVTVITDPSVPASAATAVHLRAAGVEVAPYPVRQKMIDHVKLMVVDGGAAAVVGGINWGASSAPNHDFDALVRGPAAANLERVLLRDLATTGHPVGVPDETPDPAIAVATTLPDAGIRALALELLDVARESLDLELFVLTDAAAVHALRRAHARGVRVRLLLDPDQRPSDASADLLRAAGVAVRLYRGTGEKLHAKAAVADGHRVLFGSANWTSGGFERNHELDIGFDSAPAAATLLAAMRADWAASAP
jgi:phosphatidylserine/phosphatidylglycerophosphate/cardiolipin synthase-like enzyme